MDTKSEVANVLLLKLVSASTEVKVKQIIEDDPILSKGQNWRPYGGYYGNFNTIYNQQENSANSLAEKPINSIDHLLLKEGKLRNIDPEADKAPKSMQEGWNYFLELRRGTFPKLGGERGENWQAT